MIPFATNMGFPLSVKKFEITQSGPAWQNRRNQVLSAAFRCVDTMDLEIQSVGLHLPEI
jgi:hypothetical protein